MSSLLGKLKVAIIGGGLSGIATAHALVKLGCGQVSVFERAASAPASAPFRLPSSCIIAANGVRVLDALDVASSVSSKGQPVIKFTQRNARSDLLISIDTLSFLHETIKTGQRLSSLAIPYHSLLRTLSTHLPPDTVHYNHKVTAIDRVDKGYEIKFDNPSTNKTQQADLIVGADGLQSSIRQNYVHPDGRSRPRQLPGYLVEGVATSKRLATDEQTDDELLEVWGNGLRFGCCRLQANSDQVWWYATVHESFQAKTQSPSTLASTFSAFPAGVVALINATPTQHYQCDRLADLPPSSPLYKDGVVLVGSAAAHLTIDYHQQPAQCLESALALSLSLLSSNNLSSALDRYSRTRSTRLLGLSNAAFPETETALKKGGFMASLRDMATSLIPRQTVAIIYENALNHNVLNDFPELSKNLDDNKPE